MFHTSLTAAPHEIRFVRNVVLVLDQRLTIGVSLDAYQMVLTHVLPAILCSRQCTVAISPLFFRALEHAFSLKCIWEVVQFWSQIYDPGVGRVCPLRIDHSCLSVAIGLMWSPLYLRYMICQPTSSCTVFRMESKRGNLRGSDYDSAAGLLAFSL